MKTTTIVLVLLTIANHSFAKEIPISREITSAVTKIFGKRIAIQASKGEFKIAPTTSDVEEFNLYLDHPNNPRAQNNIGLMYLNGRGVRQDYSKAAKSLTKAADQGLAAAQYNLANMYCDGSLTRNEKTAVRYFTMAARQGLAQAQYNLAVLLSELPQAVKWYERSAEQGHLESKFNLAVMLESGDGVPQDVGRAFSLFREAAEKGLVEAQYGLGARWANKSPILYKAAYEWILKAAKQGYAPAEDTVAKILHEGMGVEKDIKEATAWYLKAAIQGHANSQLQLAIIYLQGGDDLRAQAFGWLVLSSAQGNEIALTRKRELQEALTPDEVKRGLALAAFYDAKEPTQEAL